MREAWEERVFEQVVWWDEWGCDIPNPRASLPAREYQAFQAILEGRNQKRREDRKKQEREARRKGR